MDPKVLEQIEGHLRNIASMLRVIAETQANPTPTYPHTEAWRCGGDWVEVPER